MSDHLAINGRLIAQARLERRFFDRNPDDDVYLFHATDHWTVLTLARSERHNEDGLLTEATAFVSTASYDSVDELEAAIEDDYSRFGWRQLLDSADPSCDPDLTRAWATEQIERNFNAASLHLKELAVATGLLGGAWIESPARNHKGWRRRYLKVMAAHLVDSGFQVLEETLGAKAPPSLFDDPTLGALRVRRYGYDATGIVRVDDVGELFIRLLIPDDNSPALIAIFDG